MNQNPVFVVPIIAVAANVVTFFDDADILVTALGQLTGYYSAGETAPTIILSYIVCLLMT